MEFEITKSYLDGYGRRVFVITSAGFTMAVYTVDAGDIARRVAVLQRLASLNDA